MSQLVEQSSITEYAPWLFPVVGLCALYIPTYVNLSTTLWATDEQGHGPIILALILWFFWRKSHDLHNLPLQPVPTLGWSIMLLGVLLYVVGRSQDILLFEVGSQIPVVTSILLLMRGKAAVRLLWFPLLFMIFMVPLPGTVVDALTLPMKTAVSGAVDQTLHWAGYPISRSGVILQIGQYKLLIADACAGLHTLFTLEAMGLFYLHVVHRESWLRNTLLAIAIIPISFIANTIRVIVLALITYYFGDEAGQGFLHGFAGMVLFISALILIISFDSMLHFFLGNKEGRGEYVTQ